MSNAAPQELGVLAKLVIVLAVVLIVAGVVWHGVTGDAWRRFWHDLVERPDEPMRATEEGRAGGSLESKAGAVGEAATGRPGRRPAVRRFDAG